MNGSSLSHLLLEPGLVQPLVLVREQLLAPELQLQVPLQVELQLQVVQLLLGQLLQVQLVLDHGDLRVAALGLQLPQGLPLVLARVAEGLLRQVLDLQLWGLPDVGLQDVVLQDEGLLAAAPLVSLLLVPDLLVLGHLVQLLLLLALLAWQPRPLRPKPPSLQPQLPFWLHQN